MRQKARGMGAEFSLPHLLMPEESSETDLLF